MLLAAAEDGVFYPGNWSDDGASVFATLNRGESWRVVQIDVRESEYEPVNVGLNGAGVSDVMAGRLLIESVEKDNDSEIYLFDLNTEELVRLTDNENNEWHAGFHPDGRAFVFDSQGQGGLDIYQHDMETGVVTQLTDHPESEQVGRYSPDGELLAFHRRMEGDNSEYDIFIRNLDSGYERRFTSAAGDDSYADWREVGGQIVFSSNRNGNYDLFVACSVSGETKQVTNDAFNEKYPRWSPDGEKILYQSDRSGAGALYILEIPQGPDC